ncbi:peptidoglycan DD-metalloendopeptidase family protein [Cytobacillus purgationiresistens]|uniref:Murein DD-endopeptidase MepM/ murein hydrolase activator NlpD n=1 Tax=Cytobacillus purgationiresistens TaxID=863449 RepID=A0ABU0AQB1_9BACI|nr:peptidoglycan DD-metalloendopeptidase family protein [Cytobacillus purgationiresistens]MDQ0273491.1 murein DD-endopeptidase MepM/ murein hydrolase activator NlpD [Cytobacillus purgationiresistens]
MPQQQQQQEDKNAIVEVAKQQAKNKAKKALRNKATALLKKGAKIAAKITLNAVMGAFKALLSFLATVGLPYILIIGGVLLAIFIIYFSVTFIFSDTDSGLNKVGKNLQNHIIAESEKTVDMSKPEQVPYRVPPELIIAALQLYESTNNGKSAKEAVTIMAETLKPVFTYEESEGSIETNIETCVTTDGKTNCSTDKEKKPYTVTMLTSVEAWDRIMTSTVTPFTTDWKTSVKETTEIKTRPKIDSEGFVVPDEVEEYEVIRVVTTKTRANTHIQDKIENEDYTYFNRVLSDSPFNYGQEDKLLVEALYEATGNYIAYKAWLTGNNSMVGYDGTVIPGEGVPAEYMQYYLEAEKVYKVDWYYIAAIHFVETGFSTHPTMISSAGAEGHVQFMPCTWLGWSYPGCKGSNGYVNLPDSIKYNPLQIKKYGGLGVDADKNGVASPWEIKDAIFTAASLLNRNGFSKNIDNAIFAYNRADWYVTKVKSKAQEFRDSAKYMGTGELNPGSFIRPTVGTITSTHGWRVIQGQKQFHNGIDIATKAPNTSIVSAADGVVTRVVTGCPPQGSFGNRCGGGFGNHVYIKHNVGGREYEAVYAHMRKVGGITLNQKVVQGQFLGIMGTSGSSTGVHLHFELHNGTRNGRATALNPALYVPL